MNNKKTKIAIIAVIALVLVTIGFTYAYWLITRTQTKTNVIGAGCLDISLTDEQNDISLQNQFPLSDEDGMKLTPYTFTVTNNCNTSVDYQLNLELLGDSATSIASTSIKIGLNDSSFILGNKETRDTTEENAYTSYQLMYGRLEAKGTDGSSDTHNLRLWLDKEAPIEEMNKTLESKIVVRAGQGIENPYNEGTMAFRVVGNAGGSGYVTELNAKWQEGEWGEAIATSYTSGPSYYWGTEYEFDETTGYTLKGDIVQATPSECREGTKECGEYTILDYSSETASGNTLYKVISFTSEVGEYYITTKKRSLSSDFDSVTNEKYAQIHKTKDDLGDSYYYRGAVENNYVKFGAYQETSKEVRGYSDETTQFFKTYTSMDECESASSYNYNCSFTYELEEKMYWRIIRFNGDGTIRMIYDGTNANKNGAIHKVGIIEESYNIDSYNHKSVGYTYEDENGTQINSVAKNVLDTWYDTNLETKYGAYIADSIFCNDRTSRTESNNIYYGAYDRLYNNKAPSLICSQKEDRYTINTEYGNGYLTNPVGLITADEVAMAGGVYGAGQYPQYSNTTYYLYAGSRYFTITPSNIPYRNAGFMWGSAVDGRLTSHQISLTNYDIRPVINLKADVEFTGEGTIDSPYEIIID